MSAVAELQTAFSPDTVFMSKFLTRDALSRRWGGICGRTIRRLEKTGVLPKGRMIFGKVSYPISAIEQAEEKMLNGVGE